MDHFITRETIEDVEPSVVIAILLDVCGEEDGLVLQPSENPTRSQEKPALSWPPPWM